tara:strand:+ start:454 stop:681 length:228 start_codon:yes stop_codon:yes gene_type:complete
MKYTYTNSSLLKPDFHNQYCSVDGNFVVIPMVGKKVKYTTIIEGNPTGKVYRKFDKAMKDVLKLQDRYNKKSKKK